MRRYLRSLKQQIVSHPGLCLLVILLGWITIVTLKPGFYLLGWDNYSSYFNLPTNIFRTLFATWLDYRGLGVPSDAEVTDIFRQIFYWLMHFFLPEQLLDQTYYLMALWVGVIGMYALSRQLLKDFFFPSGEVDKRHADLFGLLVAFFYLFNLNTLSVFYSPIIPFTNRFYGLPLLLFVFMLWKNSGNRRYLWALVITTIITSGSYITPTVMITSFMAIFIFLLSKLDIKKAILTSVAFLALNAFWVLPFLNYTIQKSAIIPLARTFVEINESTLNKQADAFALDKQIVLFPSFLELKFRSLSDQSFPIHPLLTEFTQSPVRFLLYLFPLFYILGMMIMFFKWRSNRSTLWIPAWILLFMFLSLKEFGPSGFIYKWLEDQIPLFGVLFRISDTKFHAYISLAGSIAAAYAVTWIFLWFRHRGRLVVGTLLVIVAISYGYMFRSYVSGNLIGFFAYAQVPSAYKEIAQTINVAPGYGRVLHLPMDKWHSYWRSFSWGYVGSAFFNFLLDKPYVDKTFEPGSFENSILHASVESLIDAFYRTNDPAYKRGLAENFLHLLQNTGIQYVLVDGSISSSIDVRNVIFDAKQWYVQGKDMLDYLADNQIGVMKKGTYNVPLDSLVKDYQSLYPTRVLHPSTLSLQDANLTLYEITRPQPVVHTISSTYNIDPGITNLLENISGFQSSLPIQNPSAPAAFVPFIQENNQVSRSENSFTISYHNPNSEARRYQIATTPVDRDSYLIDVSARVDNGKLNLTFAHRYYPEVNGQKFANTIGSLSLPLPTGNLTSGPQGTIISDWSEEKLANLVDVYRLQLNDVFIPLPSNINSQDKYIASYMLHEKVIKATLFSKTSDQTFDLSGFTPTTSPSCFGPPATAYAGDVHLSTNGLELAASSGSACAVTTAQLPVELQGKKLYGELGLKLQADDDTIAGMSQLYICLREGSISDCLNGHRNLRIKRGETEYRLPLRNLLSSYGSFGLDLGIVNPSHSPQSVTTSDIRTYLYTALGDPQELGFAASYPPETVEVSGPLALTIPKAVSAYSFLGKPENESWYMPFDNCRGDVPQERIVNFDGKNTIFSYMRNCSFHLAQWVNYASDRPYLFAFEYWLGSGQQPSIVLGRSGDNYFFERASLYQGYPNLPGMSRFVDPGQVSNFGQIQGLLQGINLTSASRFIGPLYYSDSAPADAAIHLFQDTANTGLVGVRAFDMFEYPAAWRLLTLTPAGAATTYASSESELPSQMILPSLWRVTGPLPDGAIMFNRGFDAQWGIYDNLLGVLVGKSLAPAYKCAGYANCFDLKGQQVKATSYYIFYTPERLSLLGWLVTLVAVGLVGKYLVLRRH